MAINSNIFIHETDKAALEALKSIPGFTQVVRSVMKVWNEKAMYINNMARNIKISKEQLPKYYDMLLPICDKLGIDVPDLFLELDVRPNAYTSGDTKPFIVLTSGLIETLPEELIPTVLAHECGHIACHHVLYRTMGRIILAGSLDVIPLKNLALLPIQMAFSHWMRCSELSADRAAVLCDGTSDKVVEMCMRLSGFTSAVPYEMNKDSFMNQAVEYKNLVNDNALNKTLEFMMFNHLDHPINSIRAYESKQWESSEDFIKAKEYFSAYYLNKEPLEIPIPNSKKYFLGRNFEDVVDELRQYGFNNVETARSVKKDFFIKEKNVINISFNGLEKFNEGDWVMPKSKVVITYYLPFSEEEIAAMHPNEVKIPNSSRYYIGKSYEETGIEFLKLGLENMELEAVYDLEIDDYKKINTVLKIFINGNADFSKGEWIDKNSKIKIMYHKIK